MIRKEIVNPGRMRRMPEGFGWVDHRLVRKGYFKERSREALTLYLFLVTVGDANGLSYYSEESLCRHLNFSNTELAASRKELVKAELAAYKAFLSGSRPSADDGRKGEFQQSSARCAIYIPGASPGGK